MKPEDLLNQTKLYQFLISTKSRNAIKFNNIPKAHKERVEDLLSRIEDWMNKN